MASFSLIIFCFYFSLPSIFDGFVSGISLGSSLAVNANNFWVSSPKGSFAFGFFNRSDEEPNQYGLGIRYNSLLIPTSAQRVVWSAGGDVIVGPQASLQLTMEGDLVLLDPPKSLPAWTSNTSKLSVSQASLLDNGNLILLDSNNKMVWQSFETPSDTVLPGQNLTAQTLRAATRDTVSSYYSLALDDTGQLELKWETSINYWRSGTASLGAIGLMIGSNGALQLYDKEFRPVWLRFGEDHDDPSVGFRHLRLDMDGNLRMYSWVKEIGSWREVWRAIENRCEVFATCGQQGLCVLTPTGEALCRCPFKSSEISNSSENIKCLAPYQQCSSGTTLTALKHTVLYSLYPPHDAVNYLSLSQCRDSCLSDETCTAVTVMADGSGECRMKTTRFVTGYKHASVPSISYVKDCLDPMALNPGIIISQTPSVEPSSPKRRHGFCLPCLLGAACGTLLAFFVIQIGVCFCFLRHRRRKEKIHMERRAMAISRGPIRLTYLEIKDLTKDFSEKLGSAVYKGVLPGNRLVAIKELERDVPEKQFRSVLSMVGSIHHKNLVKLEGYCCDSEHRYMVYEYMKNGSLDSLLVGPRKKRRLSWRRRAEIWTGVSRGLAYLHGECHRFIGHGSLKLENILLDQDLVPHLTHFALPDRQAPRAEIDVLAFGKLLLEMVTGQVAGPTLCAWAYEEWAQGRVQGVLDADLDGSKVAWGEVERVLRVAFWCLQARAGLRPSIAEVVKVLEGLLTVDPPPFPFNGDHPLTENEGESPENGGIGHVWSESCELGLPENGIGGGYGGEGLGDDTMLENVGESPKNDGDGPTWPDSGELRPHFET
ncbi:hypothetical protein AMTRI_Chr03g45520 [Amborella trichopoda]